MITMWSKKGRTYTLNTTRNEFVEADAVVISHPNSGRTWLNDITDLYRRLEPSAPEIVYTHDILDPPMDDILRWQDMIEVATHPIRQLGKLVAYHKPIVIITRDPRDVMVSYFYQKTVREPWLYQIGTITQRPLFQGTLDQFVMDDIYGITHLVTFMKLMAHHIKNGAYHLTYEAMHRDIRKEVENVLKHMGHVAFDADKVEAAILGAQFETAQILEQEEIGNNAPGNAYKYRVGKVGEGKKQLSRGALKYINLVLERSLDSVYGEYVNG